MGSGSWQRFGTKATVEDSLGMSMRDFRGRIFLDSSGTLTWSGAGDSRSTVGFSVTWGDAPIITLKYRWGGEVVVRIPVHLQATPTQFGGSRWWFTCPLIVNGEACNRRVGKLFLPPGAKYFGCRTCHKLTYRSCQEAHQSQRLLGCTDRWLDSMNRRDQLD